jgi:hypothetical protein
MQLATLTAALLVCGTARAQWNLGGWEPARCDLVVLGTLSSLEGGLALAHGAAYDTTLGTIDVERVLYAREGVAVPARVHLYAGQLAGLLCPRVTHEAHLRERGVWLLQRSDVEGTYTAYRPEPVMSPDLVEPERPRVRFALATLGPSRTIDVRVRFENFGPRPATFPAGRSVVVEALATRTDPRADIVIDLPGDPVSVSPWRFEEQTVRVVLPRAMRGCRALHLRPAGSDGYDGCAVDAAREVGGDGDPPIWLEPGAPTRLSLGYPAPLLLALGAPLGALPLSTRGRTWRWRARAEALGVLLTTGSLSLLPWSVLGLFTWTQLWVGALTAPRFVLAALAYHGVAAGLLYERVSQPHRHAVIAGTCAPAVVIAAAHGAALAWAALA